MLVIFVTGFGCSQGGGEINGSYIMCNGKEVTSKLNKTWIEIKTNLWISGEKNLKYCC